jgi:cysteine-S-conjugate beta-lyase
MRYDFDSVIDRHGTGSLKWDYEEKLTGKTGMIPLWVADMDFSAPREITDAIRRRVEHGVFGYTMEPESYFQAASAWLRKRHGWEVRREWMRSCSGVIPSLTAAILALTEPGDGIVIQPPVYYPFAMRIAGHGRRVIENPLALDGTRWDMDLDGLEKVLDSTTKMLVLCSPHNPVGRVWEKGTLARLAEICARRGIVVVSDEIHCDLVMRGHRHVPFAMASEAAASVSVVLTSVTKTFNLAGLAGSISVVADPGLRKRLDAVYGSLYGGLANALAIPAAEAAWRDGEPWLEEMLLYVGENFRFMTEWIGRRMPKVTPFPLEGTYLPLLDMRRLGYTDRELKDRLMRNDGVWLDEGPMFGRGGEGCQRLNIACPRSILAQALERMERALR